MSINSFYTPIFNTSFMPMQLNTSFIMPQFSIFNNFMPMPFVFTPSFNPFWQPSFMPFSFNFQTKTTTSQSAGSTHNNPTVQQSAGGDPNKGRSLINYAQQFVNKTSAQMSQIMRQKGYAFHSGVWCADFVNFIVGTNPGNNAPNWYKNIHNKSWVGNVVKAARPAGKVVAERKNGKIDFSNARPGDIIIFDWEGNSYATGNDDKTDHIGLVKEVKGNSIVTIEGNNGGKVSQITYTPNGRGCFANTRSIHSVIRLA